MIGGIVGANSRVTRGDLCQVLAYTSWCPNHRGLIEQNIQSLWSDTIGSGVRKDVKF